MTEFSRINTNAGHGHAWERPDGHKARCGGPRICPMCAEDAALVSAAVEWAKGGDVDPGPRTDRIVIGAAGYYPADLDKLDKLLAEATPRPWGFSEEEHGTINGFLEPNEFRPIVHCSGNTTDWLANSALILEAVMSLPSLIARCRASAPRENRITELLEANNRYQQEARDARAEVEKLRLAVARIEAAEALEKPR